MADIKTYTPDETIGLIKIKASDATHGDSFLVKVHRRIGVVGGFAGRSELTTTLAGATVEQICNAETWLPKLVGGGNYIARIYSELDAGKQLGGDLVLQFNGEPRQPDPNVLRSAGWKGPLELRYPEFGPQPQTPFMTLGGNVIPIPQNQNTTAPPTMANTIPLGPSAAELELKQQLQQLQAIAQAAQAQLAQRDRDLVEERANRREEQLRREHAASMGDLRAEIAKIANAAPTKSPIDTIAALAPVFTPLIQAMIATSAETRQLMAKIQADSQQQFQAIMMKSMERPAVSPEVTALMDKFTNQLERLREADPSQSNMVAQMADAFGGMTSMMVNVMGQVADSGLIGGKQESTGMLVVKEIAKALEAFGRATANAGQPRRRVALPRPAQAPVAATATGPQRPIVAPAAQPAQPQPQPNGFAGIVNPLDEVQAKILAEEDPVAVADFFVSVINNTAVQGEIAESGTLIDVFRNRLSDVWLNDHTDYAQALLSAVQEKMQALGIIVEEGEGNSGEAAE